MSPSWRLAPIAQGGRFAPDRAWCFSSSTPPSRTCDRPRVFDPGLCSFGARPDVRRLRRPRVDRLAPSLRRCSRLHARIGLIHLCRAMHPQRSLNGNLFLRQTMKRAVGGAAGGCAAPNGLQHSRQSGGTLAMFSGEPYPIRFKRGSVHGRCWCARDCHLAHSASRAARGRGGGVESLVAGSGVVAARPLRRSSRASPSAAGL
jgi:hypothetical protein